MKSHYSLVFLGTVLALGGSPASTHGATLSVCKSGCAFTSAQQALDASSNGDTIVLAAGQNFGDLIIPGGRHDLTIKSSQIDTYPRNTRIVRNSPTLARLVTITAGSFSGWMTATPGTSLLTSTGGGTPPLSPIAHGLHVGDRVAIGGARYSAYHCASVNQPPYTTGACDASRVGFFNIRANTNLSNGHVLYFKGRNLPTPLLENTPYYVVNFGFGGSVANADKFQVASTPGGAPIMVPQFDPYGRELVIEDRPLPQAIHDTMYVVSTPSPSTMELSSTPSGPPTIWSQIPVGYNGSQVSIGVSFVKLNPVYNITFDGIELLPTSNVYYPFYVSSDAGNASGENYNIRVLRSWIHGPDNQKSFPMCLLNIGGHDLEIGWNIFEGAYSTGNDTQDIGFMSSHNVNIHDNEIKGATEGIMSGGNTPWFAYESNTTGISVTQNYFWKPIKSYQGIGVVYLSPTSFQLLSRLGNADCSTVASDPRLGSRCFAYEGEGERCSPTSPPVSRFEWNQPAANSIFTASGAAGQEGDIYVLNGALHMDHNFSGGVTCPQGVICTATTNPAFPPNSTRIAMAVIGPTGVFDGTFWLETRNSWSKNHLESKYGDYWDIEGNVFSGQNNCDNGSTCQDPAIQFTVAGNGSGGGEAVNYMVSSSSSIIRNNIFEHLSAGITGVGKTFPINIGGVGLAYEFAGFGQSINNLVENNLFIDLGSTEYTAALDGTVVRTIRTENWTIRHNTAVDVRLGFAANADRGIHYDSNILIPYQSACPGAVPGTCLTPSPITDVGVQDNAGPGPLPAMGGEGASSWTAAQTNGNVDAASTFTHNMVMNRSGFIWGTKPGIDYPTDTYLVAPDSGVRDPNPLFVNWQEGGATLPPNGCVYQQADYHLAPGQAALYPSTDGSPLGANIDAIEALVGAGGDVVDQGTTSPTFAVGPTITMHPQDKTVAAGENVTFSVRATGRPDPIYQWQVLSPKGDVTPIQGATNSSLTLSAVAVSSSVYQFQCLVSNIVRVVPSRPASLTVTSGAGTLSHSNLAVRVYPNPWRADTHATHPQITFEGNAPDTTIKIFTTAGHEIKKLTSNGTIVSWDLTNKSGAKVASGIYIYLVTDNQGRKARGKITIIK